MITRVEMSVLRDYIERTRIGRPLNAETSTPGRSRCSPSHAGTSTDATMEQRPVTTTMSSQQFQAGSV
uniref:Uncharacterized protein n=1 Tax=Ditylenchus dipsaci TaxID=166011 RepID=A0A915CWJ2_9BILA